MFVFGLESLLGFEVAKDSDEYGGAGLALAKGLFILVKGFANVYDFGLYQSPPLLWHPTVPEMNRRATKNVAKDKM